MLYSNSRRSTNMFDLVTSSPVGTPHNESPVRKKSDCVLPDSTSERKWMTTKRKLSPSGIGGPVAKQIKQFVFPAKTTLPSTPNRMSPLTVDVNSRKVSCTLPTDVQKELRSIPHIELRSASTTSTNIQSIQCNTIPPAQSLRDTDNQLTISPYNSWMVTSPVTPNSLPECNLPGNAFISNLALRRRGPDGLFFCQQGMLSLPQGDLSKPPKSSRRAFTNCRERERQQSVNAAYAELRKLLPTHPVDKKLSKHEILRKTIWYIEFLVKLRARQEEEEAKHTAPGPAANIESFTENNNNSIVKIKRENCDSPITRDNASLKVDHGRPSSCESLAESGFGDYEPSPIEEGPLQGGGLGLFGMDGVLDCPLEPWVPSPDSLMTDSS